jgi:hypothetical protein
MLLVAIAPRHPVLQAKRKLTCSVAVPYSNQDLHAAAAAAGCRLPQVAPTSSLGTQQKGGTLFGWQ